jgi:hypothetical protein
LRDGFISVEEGVNRSTLAKTFSDTDGEFAELLDGKTVASQNHQQNRIGE